MIRGTIAKDRAPELFGLAMRITQGAQEGRQTAVSDFYSQNIRKS